MSELIRAESILTCDTGEVSTLVNTIAGLSADIVDYEGNADHLAHACKVLAYLAEIRLDGEVEEALGNVKALQIENEALRDMARKHMGDDAFEDWQSDFDANPIHERGRLARLRAKGDEAV